MINQNNSKSFISVNPSLTNKKVSQFIQKDTLILKRRNKTTKKRVDDFAEF